MDSLPVLYGLLIYVVYVIIPLIPAILIYKLFPKTAVGAEGLLAGLKINASGAFAAYLITVILGHFIIKQNLAMVQQMDGTNWRIFAPIEFVDFKGDKVTDISDLDVENKLDIKVVPDPTFISKSGVQFMVYAEGSLPRVNFSYPGFEPVFLDLGVLGSEKADRSFEIILDTMQFIKNDAPYDPGAFTEGTDSNNSFPIPIGGPATNH